MTGKRFLAAALGVLLALATAGAGADSPGNRVAVKGSFETVKENLLDVIAGRGLVVANVSHVGEMLERTGRDLGFERRIFGQAEIIEFCSALLSRRLMEADPHNIVLCPFSVSIYTLPDDPRTVYLAYRKPQVARPDAALEALETFLKGIVQEAAGY